MAINCNFEIQFYGSPETNSRVFIYQKAGSQPAKIRFCKIHALDQQDKHTDLYTLFDPAGN